MPLTNHTDWKKRELSISSLHLDLQNPRLAGETKSEAEAIDKLVKVEDVEQLARQISQVGYVPVEDLVIVEENGQKIVIEGNRRLAAYKLLHKPERAPREKIKTFQSLKTDLGENLPKKVYVVIAPDRTQANIYVYLKHTPETFSKRWSKIQQAVFMQRLASGGESLEEIKRICRATDKEISEALATLEIYELAPLLNLPAGIKLALSDPRNFPYSTVIERIIAVQSAQKRIGYSFSADKGIVITGGLERFRAFITRILRDAMTPDPNSPKRKLLDTRALGDTGKLGTYLDEIEQELPKVTTTTASAAVKTLYAKIKDEAPSAPSPNPPAVPPALTAPPPRHAKLFGNGLFTTRLVCSFPDHRLPTILKELQQIDVKSYKNSTALLLRLVVELALVGGIKAAKCWPALNTYFQSGGGNAKAYPTMASMLNFVLKPNTGSTIILEQREIAVVSALVSKKSSLFSIDALNAYVHNESYPATVDDLRKIAANLEPFLKALLAIKP